MFPSLLAEETKRAVTEYLSTTFALADEDVRGALERFLLDTDRGIFQGPYLRVRTPYRPVDPSWRSPLSWLPPGFTPYRHQARAFERLSTLGRSGGTKPAEPTIVTTGTGSGKTESFLLPLLDHAKRARERGERGMKAILLYPMNALVTDQAARIAGYLHSQPELAGVTAGVYIGGTGTVKQSTPTQLVDHRETLRDNPPDILLTNYKMLDLLLLRSQDRPLWEASRTSLQFVVLDEFHTYDGAQGTDVAMLLRRLGATLKVAEPGRPLGRITPVATSATLGGGTRSQELLTFAETVFGTPFPPDALVTEERLRAEEIVADIDYGAGVPDAYRLADRRGSDADAALADAMDADSPDGWHALAAAAFEPAPTDAAALGEVMRRNYLTLAVLKVLSGRPLTTAHAAEELGRAGVLPWGAARAEDADRTERALLRFLALLSVARTTDGRPLVNLEAQLWVRELSRMLRVVAAEPQFSWWDDGTADDDRTRLPAIHCRACGHSGWMAVVPEVGDSLEGAPRAVWQASVNYTKRSKTRALLRTSPDDPAAKWLDPQALTLSAEPKGGLEARPRAASHLDQRAEAGGLEARPRAVSHLDHRSAEGLVPVLVTPSEEAAQEQRCPSCGANDAIRFLGSSVATLASVALTSQFGSRLVPDAEKKTLVFTDSVQDAAHRAAFIEGRAFSFNLRSVIVSALRGEPTGLDVVAQRLGELDPADRYAVAPPDFVRRLGLEGEWLRGRSGARAARLLATRLALQAQLEVGHDSRTGRTLELTGSVAIDVDLDLGHHAALARETHANLPQLSLAALPEVGRYEQWLLGLLDRLRTQGGIVHPWLERYMRDDGRRWSIWGGSPPGMRKYPRGRPAPAYWTTGRSEGFDSLTPQGDNWLTNWTSRCLEVSVMEARALLPAVAKVLAGEGGPLIAVTSAKGHTVYGLDPSGLVLHPVTDESLADGSAMLRCPECDHVQPAAPGRLETWLDAACPRLRCHGVLEPSPARTDNFYRRLYLGARVRRIVTHEHTGLLERTDREDVERRFKAGDSPVDPNILTCTPTLELGIDIGDLSTVTLSSLPRATANYLQRVGRAGRSTGNAFVLATVPSAPRDLYYFADPLALIDGEVLPPGAYLNATEILQRQYFAFCLDRVADGSLDLAPVPNLLGGVLGKHLEEGEWLRIFVDRVTERAEELSAQFLGLYGAHLDETATAALAEFAAGGLRLRIAQVATEWLQQRTALDERIGALVEAIAELERAGHRDAEQEADLRRWKGELKGVRDSRRSMGQQESLTGLVELGLLPNYQLLDDATTLDVRLWWTSDEGGRSSFHSVEHSVERGSRTALTELAPGASFYVFGSRIAIDGVDLGPSDRPAWSTLRLCPDCGHGETYTAGDSSGPCPRCGNAHFGDPGARHAVLPLRRVTAVQPRDEAVLDDDTEDRTRTRFTVVTGVSVDAKNVLRAWRLDEVAFGAEYVRDAEIRSINVGKADQLGGSQTEIAGQTVAAPGFLTCPRCGVVADDFTRPVKHRGWCPHRAGRTGAGEVEPQRLFLSHDLRTQAVRMLLPISTLQITERLASFSAALQLGLRLDFGGDPQHLAITTAAMPDSERRPRQFVVLHDTVPGGTGYLDRFGDPDRLRAILQRARDFLASCACRDEGRRACHRCLLGVVPPRDVEVVDRSLALELLDELLTNWSPTEVATVTDIDISDVEINELERRFFELVKRWAEIHEADGHRYSVDLGRTGEQLDLRLGHGDDGSGGAGCRWRLHQQVDVDGDVRTRPDLEFTRQDAQDLKVAIYLDGRQFHASREHNRTADDAHKRDALRAEGYRVWSITWNDVDDFARILDGRDPEQGPFVGAAMAAAVGEQVPDPRTRGMFGNPIEFLLSYLQDPGAPVWGETATAAAIALLQHGGQSAPVPVGYEQAQRALVDWAGGVPPTAAADGPVAIAERAGTNGLPLFVVGEAAGDFSPSLGVLAVLDDADAVVGTEQHEARWREWLRWGNVLQFLPRPSASVEEPRRMAAIWTTESLQVFAQQLLPIAIVPLGSAAGSDPEWKLFVEYADERVQPLARVLSVAGVPAPEVGFEIADGSYQVELAWEAERLAVVTDDDGARDEWLARHGWTVLRADQTGDDLATAIQRRLGEGAK